MIRRWILLPGLLFTAGICGCEKNPTNGAPHPGAVDIGLISHLTGSLADAGQDVKEGVELAAEIINGIHDLALPMAGTAGFSNLNGDTLNIIIRDDESDAATAAEVTGNLITTDGVVAVIGSYSSPVTEAASEVAEDLGIPFLCPVSTAHSLGQRDYEWFFRTTPELNVFVETYFQFFEDISTAGCAFDSIAILSVDNMWGNQFADEVARLAGENAYTVVADISYPYETGSLDAEVTQLKAAGTAVLMQASYLPGALLSMQTYKNLDYSPVAIVTYGGGFIDDGFVAGLGADAEEVISRGDWAVDLATGKPLAGQVNDLFVARFGHDLNGNSARAFTGMLVLADAVNRAASTAPDDIREALLATAIPGAETIMPWGGVAFDPDTHENTLAGCIIIQLQDGEYRTVWPAAFAAAELIWPFSGW